MGLFQRIFHIFSASLRYQGQALIKMVFSSPPRYTFPASEDDQGRALIKIVFYSPPRYTFPASEDDQGQTLIKVVFFALPRYTSPASLGYQEHRTAAMGSLQLLFHTLIVF